MNKYKFCIFICLNLLQLSCIQTNDIGYQSANSSCVNIRVSGNIEQFVQIDSIFSSISFIPLETNDNCLISQIQKIIFFSNKIYIYDKSSKLFVFDIGGKFLFEVGKNGRGPGEYLEIRDFDIDKDGNIYILDFLKIHKYSNNGTYIRNYTFDFIHQRDKLYCNPLEFALKGNDCFYIWGGSFGIEDNRKIKSFAFHEMNSEGKIVKSYFPISIKIPENYQNHRFIPYKNMTLVDPIYYMDTVYSLNNQGLIPRYRIDFGENAIASPVPTGFSYHGDFMLKIDQLYFHSIDGFIETNDWIYFRFAHKMKTYNVYFSKTMNKSFVSKVYPYFKGTIAPFMIFTRHNDSLVSYMNPNVIIDLLNQISNDEYKSLSISEKDILEKLKLVKVTDNPILLICSMKNY